MTTYNTYQEAKIANPESNIWHLNGGLFASGNQTNIPSGTWKECNPADHCMTLGDLRDKHGGEVGGDIMLGCGSGDVRIITHQKAKDRSFDRGNFILRAAALEEDKPLLQTGEEYEHTKTLNFIYERLVNVHEENPCYDYMHKLKNAIIMVEGIESPCNQSAAQEKPRTKVEYVKVVDSIFDLRPDFEAGELYISHCDGHYQQILNESSLHLACVQGLLFRRVETQMTWQDELYDYLDSSCEMNDDFDDKFTISIDDKPLDFNLNDEGFIDMCKFVASLNSVN